MKDVPGWEVGKWRGEPVYWGVAGRFPIITPEDYFQHCDVKYLSRRMDEKLYHWRVGGTDFLLCGYTSRILRQSAVFQNWHKGKIVTCFLQWMRRTFEKRSCVRCRNLLQKATDTGFATRLSFIARSKGAVGGWICGATVRPHEFVLGSDERKVLAIIHNFTSVQNKVGGEMNKRTRFKNNKLQSVSSRTLSPPPSTHHHYRQKKKLFCDVSRTLITSGRFTPVKQKIPFALKAGLFRMGKWLFDTRMFRLSSRKYTNKWTCVFGGFCSITGLQHANLVDLLYLCLLRLRIMWLVLVALPGGVSRHAGTNFNCL